MMMTTINNNNNNNKVEKPFFIINSTEISPDISLPVSLRSCRNRRNASGISFYNGKQKGGHYGSGRSQRDILFICQPQHRSGCLRAIIVWILAYQMYLVRFKKLPNCKQ